MPREQNLVTMIILVGGQGCPKFWVILTLLVWGATFYRTRGRLLRSVCLSMVSSVVTSLFVPSLTVVLPEAKDSGLGLWDRAGRTSSAPLRPHGGAGGEGGEASAMTPRSWFYHIKEPRV